MKSLTNSLKASLETSNWYSALFVALSLPDILGKFQYPKLSSQKRYALWFKENVQQKYTSNEIVFLSGNDCYALRCSALHEGSEIIENQRAREIITRFKFYSPRTGMIIHNNKLNNTLQLQVDIFCRDIYDASIKFINERNIQDDLIIRTFEMNNIIGV